MRTHIGFRDALDLTLGAILPMTTEEVPLMASPSRVLARDVFARVDSPSVTASLKDGYAVLSGDLERASSESPVRLELVGSISAGEKRTGVLRPGQAIRITTGAPIPDGADAVLAEEFSRTEGNRVVCFNDAGPGRNVQERGLDVRTGEAVGLAGTRLSPSLVGLLTSAGVSEVPVYRRPKVAVIATGDEIVHSGSKLPHGKLYASNLVEICAWLTVFGMESVSGIARDHADEIKAAIEGVLGTVDALVTSGGAWTGEKDLIVRVLNGLGWKGIYHRVRMGPGKGIAFGLLQGKPVFCLPGGPPSNEMAFLQLALPGLLAMEGWRKPLFPCTKARLTQTVRGDREWTQFIHARFGSETGETTVSPAKLKSRLQSMAYKETLIVIDEGVEELRAGDRIEVPDLRIGARISCG